MHAPFAGALSVIDRYLRFGLALQNDADLRRSIIGEEGRVSFRLPADTGWMTLGKSSFELSRAKPLPTSERAFSELVQDAAIAKQILQGTGARAHASKSEHLIRKGLLQFDRPAFRRLEDWAPLLETQVYSFGARAIQLLDHLRPRSALV